MRYLKKKISIVLLILLAAILTACGRKDKDDQGISPTENGDVPTQAQGEEVLLNLWYTEGYMQDFLEAAVARFEEENPGVKISTKLAAKSEYLENINTNSIKQTNVVDLYMLPESDLEQAYLGGLALVYDPQGTVFTTENYCETALRAVTYDNKRVAYPLCFDSAFLVYNRAYTDDKPETFDALLAFANSYEVEEGSEAENQMERVMIWNMSDVEMNYQFLGKSFLIGGENGDDRSSISIYNSKVIKCLEYYKALNDFFALDRTTITDNEVVEYFVSGKAAFTITNTAGLTTLHTAGMNFGVCDMPDLTENLPAGSLSTTEVMVVNPYSRHQNVAQKLVQALAYDYADDFYVKTGFFPARFNWDYNSDMVDGVYANYADSVSRPKLMNLGDLFVHLEILLHNVWDDGDTETLLMDFQQYVKEQLER